MGAASARRLVELRARLQPLLLRAGERVGGIGTGLRQLRGLLGIARPVGAEDLVSADGACPGMAPPPGPADANASTTAPMGGTVALGHTECDVVRGIGAPSDVSCPTMPPAAASPS